MWIPVVTFGVVVALVLGAYWFFVVRPEDQARKTVVSKARMASLPAQSELVIAKPEEHLSSIPLLEWVLSRAGRLLRPLQQMRAAADIKMSVGALLLLCGIAALGTHLLIYYLTGLVGLAALLAVVALFSPLFVVSQKASRRLNKFEEQFPEAIDLIARALRAGHAFSTGLGMAADEVDAPAGVEFRRLYEQQNYGMSLNEAMRDFATRVPLLDARFFATAVLTQREAGGNLSEVLDNLSNVIRERFRVKRQVRVHTAHARMTGLALILFPPFLAAMFFAISPENMKLLVTDPMGIKMLVAAVFLQLLGTLLIRKLVDIDY